MRDAVTRGVERAGADFLLLCTTTFHKVADEVEAAYGYRAAVIPNGVDAGRFARAAGPEGAPARDAWTARLGGYVLALGGIEPRKGTIDLIEAFARLDRRDLQLVIGGGETLFDYRDYRADPMSTDQQPLYLDGRCAVGGPVRRGAQYAPPPLDR